MGFLQRLHDRAVREALTEAERNTRAFLADASRLPIPEPALTRPTRVRVLRPFMVCGRRVEPGETVTLAFHDARSLAALHRCELLHD